MPWIKAWKNRRRERRYRDRLIPEVIRRAQEPLWALVAEPASTLPIVVARGYIWARARSVATAELQALVPASAPLDTQVSRRLVAEAMNELSHILTLRLTAAAKPTERPLRQAA